MKKLISEVFDDLEKASSENDRINILRSNNTPALRKVLNCAYNPEIKFTVSRWPNFKPSNDPEGLSYASLYSEMDRIYLFIEGHSRRPTTLTEKRSTEILIQMLENMTNKEAITMLNMMMKNLKVKGLNKKVALTAFPNLMNEVV